MSDIFEGQIQNRKTLEINAQHIPQWEYQNLDKAFEVNAPYSFLASFYGRGVLLFLFNKDEDNAEYINFKRDFSVLFSLAKKAMDNDVYFLDLDEEGTKIFNLKQYDWTDDEPLTPYGDLPEKTQEELPEIEDEEDDDSYVDANRIVRILQERKAELDKEIAEAEEKETTPPSVTENNNAMDWIRQMAEYIAEEKRRQNERFS